MSTRRAKKASKMAQHRTREEAAREKAAARGGFVVVAPCCEHQHSVAQQAKSYRLGRCSEGSRHCAGSRRLGATPAKMQPVWLAFRHRTSFFLMSRSQHCVEPPVLFAPPRVFVPHWPQAAAQQTSPLSERMPSRQSFAFSGEETTPDKITMRRSTTGAARGWGW